MRRRRRRRLAPQTGAGTAVEFNALNHMEFTHTVDTKRSTFVFDRVYQPAASQAEVFQDCAPVVRTAMKKSRIVTLRFGTARQKMALERWTNPILSRRTRILRYWVPAC